jgi:hypothetical protein
MSMKTDVWSRAKKTYLTGMAVAFGGFAVPNQQAMAEQWYTGSLVSPSGPLSKKGMFLLEPYMYYAVPSGMIGPHNDAVPMSSPRQQSVTNLTIYRYAVTDTFSIQTEPTIAYRWKHGDNTSSGLKLGDVPVDLMWRYLTADPARYIPTLNLITGVSFPTGDYSSLGRAQDGVGSGVYTYRVALTEQSTYTLPNNHELRLRVWATFRRALTTAHLHDVTSYGTTQGFQGRAQPGMYGGAGFSLEYGLTQRWVLALDVARDWSNGTKLRGTYTSTQQTISQTGAPSGDWQIAPAVEYNWSPHYGIIAGVSVYYAGHNTERVVSPQFAFNALY